MRSVMRPVPVSHPADVPKCKVYVPIRQIREPGGTYISETKHGRECRAYDGAARRGPAAVSDHLTKDIAGSELCRGTCFPRVRYSSSTPMPPPANNCPPRSNRAHTT